MVQVYPMLLSPAFNGLLFQTATAAVFDQFGCMIIGVLNSRLSVIRHACLADALGVAFALSAVEIEGVPTLCPFNYTMHAQDLAFVLATSAVQVLAIRSLFVRAQALLFARQAAQPSPAARRGGGGGGTTAATAASAQRSGAGVAHLFTEGSNAPGPAHLGGQGGTNHAQVDLGDALAKPALRTRSDIVKTASDPAIGSRLRSSRRVAHAKHRFQRQSVLATSGISILRHHRHRSKAAAVSFHAV